jgi:preprotein translocase subunit YajC
MREPLNSMALLSVVPALSPVLGQAAPGGGAGLTVLYVVALLAIMYFVMIRPQQQQAKATAEMLSALKKGDDVVTSGGLLGKIFAIDEKTVTLEAGAGVKLRVLKSAIQAKVTVEAKSDATDAKKEEK